MPPFGHGIGFTTHMRSVLRPLRGFGFWGCALLPVLAALIYCAAGGYDLRHAIIEFVYTTWGEDAVWDTIIRSILFGAYWGSLLGQIPGPVTLLWVLIAMFVAPRRWAWWQWSLVSAWLVFNPYLCFRVATALPLRWAAILGWEGGRPPRVLTVGQVHGLVLVQLAALAFLAWRIAGPALRRDDGTGSRWRFAPMALWVCAAMFATLGWQLNRTGNAGGVTFGGTGWLTMASHGMCCPPSSSSAPPSPPAAA